MLVCTTGLCWGSFMNMVVSVCGVLTGMSDGRCPGFWVRRWWFSFVFFCGGVFGAVFCGGVFCGDVFGAGVFCGGVLRAR